jgi:metallophosphoesterase (TIGR00282 family)
MNILLIGDIIGQPGRDALKDLLPLLKNKYDIEFTVVNGENSAGGNGITLKTAEEIFSSGADVITSGDHIWKNKDILTVLEKDQRVLRPANYPEGAPGKGFAIYTTMTGNKVAVINLLGRVFMQAIDCPFKIVTKIMNEISPKTRNIIVDIHAEATSEKIAMGWYLDGKVSCVVGTHTHVPTRDARILPQGTAYLTDLGMAGSQNSVIGVNKEAVLQRFITQLPVKFEPAKEDVWIHGAVVNIDPSSGIAKEIKMISEKHR